MEATTAEIIREHRLDLVEWAEVHAPDLLPAADVRDVPEAWAGVFEAIECARWAARPPVVVADPIPEPF